MSNSCHLHCETCVNIKKCHNYPIFKKNRKILKSISTQPLHTTTKSVVQEETLFEKPYCNGVDVFEENREDCPLIRCPIRCDFVFHACKLPEHLTLCPRQRVPCLNSGNGCDMFMERRFTGRHLTHCPASVTVCTVEWSRRSLPENGITFVQDASHLDVAALNGDLETLLEFRACVPVGLRRILQTQTQEVAMMPLGVSGNRIPDSILRQVDPKVEPSIPQLNHNDHKIVRQASPPAGLQGSLVHQLQAAIPPTNNSESGSNQKELKEPDEDLSLTIDVITKHSGRRLTCSTFMCAQELRRDEFPYHFQNVHSEIRTQLNGWLFRRCPLASYGCPYGSPKFYPLIELHDKNNSYEIQFNSTLKEFCPIRKFNSESLNVGTSSIRLTDLPNELLLRLSEYWDSSSLKCMTLTSVRMRDICRAVVRKRGIVVLDWEKSAGGWHVKGKRWIFSSAFTPIKSWRMSEEISIGNHLRHCQYYTANKHYHEGSFSYADNEELSLKF